MPPKKHTKRVRFSKKNSTRFRKRRISLRRKKVTGGQ